MKIGIALAGGGLKGVAYIGALKAFEDLGIKFDCISGTSSGSMAATLYSMGYSCNDMKNIINSSYKKIVKIKKTPIISYVGVYLTGGKFKMNGLIPGERLENVINDVVIKKECNLISDIKVPLAVATVDSISGKECLILSQKCRNSRPNIEYLYDVPISTAVRASMSFPGVFTPSKYKSYSFIDGGARDNLPIGALKDMGADITIGLDFKMSSYDYENANIFNTLLRSVDIFSQSNRALARQEANLVIEIDAEDAGLIGIRDVEKCIESGYETIMKNKEIIYNTIKQPNRS